MQTGRLGQSACLILRRMPHTFRWVEPVPGPAGYFANGGFRNVGGLPRSMVFVPRHVDGVPDPSRNRGIFLSDMADHMARRCGHNRHSKNEHGGNHSGQSKHD